MSNCQTNDTCAVNCTRCPTACEVTSLRADNEKRIRKEVQKSASEVTIAKRRAVVSKMVGESACPDNLSQAGGPGDLARSVQASCRGIGGEPVDCAAVSYNLGRIRNRTQYKNHEGVDKKHNSYERYTARKTGCVLMKEQTPLVRSRTARIGQPRNRTGTGVCANPCGGIETSSKECLSGCFYKLPYTGGDISAAINAIIIGTSTVEVGGIASFLVVILGVEPTSGDPAAGFFYISCDDGVRFDAVLQAAVNCEDSGNIGPPGPPLTTLTLLCGEFITLNPACCRKRIPSCADSTFYISVRSTDGTMPILYTRLPGDEAGDMLSSTPRITDNGPILALGWNTFNTFTLAVRGRHECLSISSVVVSFGAPLMSETFMAAQVFTVSYNAEDNFTQWEWIRISPAPVVSPVGLTASVRFNGTFDVKGCRGNNTQCVASKTLRPGDPARCLCTSYCRPSPVWNPTNL